MALQQDLIFEPTYPPRRHLVVGASLLPGVIALVTVLAAHLTAPVLSIAGLLTILPPLVLGARFVRRVVFGGHLVVFRYLLTDRYLKYEEIYRIREDGAETARGFVRFGEWTNRQAFLGMLAALRDGGKLEKTRVDPGVLPLAD